MIFKGPEARKRGRIISWLILIVGVAVFSYIKYSTDTQGLPTIKSKIDAQLTALVSQTPTLTNLVVQKMVEFRMVGNSSPFNGKFEYFASSNGSSVNLRVYWVGDSTNCHITKIETHSTFSEPRVLWEQQNSSN